MEGGGGHFLRNLEKLQVTRTGKNAINFCSSEWGLNYRHPKSQLDIILEGSRVKPCFPTWEKFRGNNEKRDFLGAEICFVFRCSSRKQEVSSLDPIQRSENLFLEFSSVF